MLIKQERILSYHRVSKCENWSEKYHQEIQMPTQYRSPANIKQKISKILERKLTRDVSKDPSTTAKTLVSSKSGIVVSKETITRALHRNGLSDCRPRKRLYNKQETPLS